MNTNFYATAAVPLVVGLVQALKQAEPKLMSAWAFLVAVALGVGLGFLIQFGVPDVQGSVANAVFGGIAIGLSAAGLYSGGAAVMDFIQQRNKPPQTSALAYTPSTTTIKPLSPGKDTSPATASQAPPKIGDHMNIGGVDYVMGISDTVSSPFPTPNPQPVQLPPSMLPPAVDAPKETPPPSPFITPVPTDKPPTDIPPAQAEVIQNAKMEAI